MKYMLRLGFVVLLACLLFPPVVSVSRSGHRAAMGHWFALSIPAGDNYVDFRIDYPQYLTLALGTLAVFGFGAVAFKRP